MSQQEDPQEPGTLTIVPAPFEHACAVYSVMMRDAKMPEEDENVPLHVMIWEGHLTRLFKDLKLAVPYYTLIKNRLVEMGCIEQTRRGGGHGTSKWVLWKQPTLDEWKAADGRRPRRGNKVTQLEQQVNMLNGRVAELEKVTKQLTKALIALDESWDKRYIELKSGVAA